MTETTLFIEGFAVEANIGIHEHELQKPQAVLIDIELKISDDFDYAIDEISNVVDYDFLRPAIRSVVASQRFNTQEALCHRILDLALAMAHIEEVTVTTRKTEVYQDARSVGCRMRRRQGDNCGLRKERGG